MSGSEPSETKVRGERATPAIIRERAISSRISSILAVTLMSALGLGLLVWYYANTLSRHANVRQAAQELARHRAQGDLPLPPPRNSNLVAAPMRPAANRPLPRLSRRYQRHQPPRVSAARWAPAAAIASRGFSSWCASPR